MRIAAFIAVLFCAGAAARADEVFLRNGQSLTGRVVANGKQVVLEVAGGTVRLAAKDVERIEQSALPEDLYAARAAVTNFQDPAAIRDLAAYAAQLKLATFATQLKWMANDVERDLCEKRLAADPDDAQARGTLARLDREAREARAAAEAAERRKAEDELAEARRQAAAAQAELARAREEAEHERQLREAAERQAAEAVARERYDWGWSGWGAGVVVAPGYGWVHHGGGGNHCPPQPRPPACAAPPPRPAVSRPPQPFQTPWQLRASPIRR